MKILPNTLYLIRNTIRYLTPNTWLRRTRLSNKLYYYTVVGLLLLIGGGTFVFQMIHPSGAAAAWFNENWLYRKEIVITAHTSAESNVYLDLSSGNALDTSDSTRFQADCGDLRFTDKAGNLLPYYVVSGCGSGTTVIHVFFDNFPAGAQSVYYYYGNPAAANGFSATDFASPSSGVSFGTLGSEENSPAPIAFWKFDDGTGTVAKDSMAGGRHGTLTGSTLPVWTSDQCVTGKCLYFNGITSNVSVASTVPGVKSIAFWINPSASATAEIMKLNATIDIRASSGTVIAPGSTSPTVYVNGVVNGTISANTWNYVIITTGTSISASAITLGKGPLGVLKGYMDEVKMYPFVLSSAQVLANYNARGSAQGANVLGAKDQAYLTKGLVGYWKMDETTADTCSGGSNDNCDSSGNAYDLAWQSTVVASPSGKFGSTAYINGAGGNGIQGTGNFTALNGAGQITFSAWAKFNSGMAENYIMHTNSSFDLRIGTNDAAVGLGSVGFGFTVLRVTTVTIQPSVWNHLVATWDGYIIRLYLNGTLIGTQYYGGGASITNASSSLTVGSINTLAPSFTGQIDEVRLYKRALSAQEVQSLYDFAPSPTVQYSFDQGTGTSVNDISGNGKTGTFTGTPTWTNGKFGKALSFNGTTDYVSAAVNLDASNNQTIYNESTVSFWMYARQDLRTATQAILSTDGADSCGDQRIYTSADNKLTFGGRCYAAPTIDITNDNFQNKWVHVAMVTDAINAKLRVYINGASRAESNLGNNKVNWVTMNLGRSNFSGSFTYFDGKIDDFKIYNYARTEKQVLEDMNAGHATGSQGTALGYYRFDDGAGNVASNSGAVVGADAQLYNFSSPPSQTSGWTGDGKFGKALNFDGADDIAEMAGSSGFDNIASLSASAWINPRSAGENSLGRIIEKIDSSITTLNGWNIRTSSTNTLGFFVDYSGTDLNVISTANALTLGRWQHILVTWDGSPNASGVHMYVNGKEVTYTTLQNGTSVRVTDAGFPLRVGNDKTRARTFDGWIDEVKIYGGVLTSTERAIDMNNGQSVQWGGLGLSSSDGITASSSANSSYCVPGDTTTLSCQPVGEWHLNEHQGTSVTDTSGNNNTGVLTNTPVWATGKVGSALRFADTDASYVSVPDSVSLSPTSVSLSAWVYMTSITSGTVDVIGKGTGYGYGINSSGTLIFGYNGGFSLSSGTNLVANRWYHVAATYDSATGVERVYINGAISNSTTQTPGSVNDNATTLRIGNNSGTGRSINGIIDEPRVYNYALTPAQVAWDYSRGKPIAQYRFDECQGSTVTDVTGNGNTGTISLSTTGTQTTAIGVGTCTVSASTPWFNGATGEQNASLNFDGTSDKVTVPDGTYTDITSSFSISAWIKRGILTQTSYGIVTKGNPASGGTNMAYGLFLGATDNPSLRVSGDNTTFTAATGSRSITDTNWHHVVGVYTAVGSGTSKLQVYVDGVPGTLVSTGPYPVATNNLTLKIGSSTDNSDNLIWPWNGQIDEVKIFNYPLTTVQVRNEYNGGAVRFGPLTGSP